MPLTTIKGSNLSAIITNTQLNTTGTASSANVLKGTFAWAGASRSGLTNFAASDPATPVRGDIWYQGGFIKIAANPNILTGIWQSGGTLPRSEEQAPVCGLQNSALLAGGENSGYKTEGDMYDGFAWRAVTGVLSNGRANAPLIGSSGACIFCAGQLSGSVTDATEEYDGMSWSAGGTMSDTYYAGVAQGFGTLTAGVCAGGGLGGSASAVTSLYNGTAWSLGNSCLSTKLYSASAGTNSAGLVTGGSSPSYSTATEEYDGTSWAAGGTLNTGRQQLAGAGTQTGALCFAGTTGSNSSVTEEYNGTVWTATNSLATARRSGGGNGSQNSAIISGGYGSGYLNSTEEWNKPRIQYYDV